LGYHDYMKIHVLASGSKGNATIIEGSGGSLLIDCGLSYKSLKARCVDVGFDPKSLTAVVLTHEHNDHVGGLGVCMRGLARDGLNLPVYATEPTLRGARVFSETGVVSQLEAVPLSTVVKCAGMEVVGFKTSHNAAEPQGFRVACDGDVVGYLTDSGTVTAEAAELLRDCDILALESNHDLRMLRTGSYPAYLKEHIASDRGHLSNAQVNEALVPLISNRLAAVIGMHLSQENNQPSLVRDAFAATLAKQGHPARVYAASQFMALTVEAGVS